MLYCSVESYALYWYLGWKLKSIIYGKFSHLFGASFPFIFLFSFVSCFPSHCFFFLGDFLRFFSFLSLTIYLIIINTVLFSEYLLKIFLNKIFVLISGYINHSIFEVFFCLLHCLSFLYILFTVCFLF